MKRIRISVVIVFCLLLAGCFEVEEKTEFKTADSGNYSIVVDMGQTLAQLRMLGQGSPLGELTNMDSSILLKYVVPGDTLLSAAEKQAIMNGMMRIHLNKDKDEMMMTLSAPFSSIENVSLVRTALFKMVSNRTKGPLGQQDGIMNSDLFAKIDMKSIGFDLQTKKGRISSTLTDSIALKQRIETDSMLQQVKPMLSLVSMPVTYKSIYQFITPVKTVTGSKAVASDDKKRVTVTNTLEELFDNLKAFEYTISY